MSRSRPEKLFRGKKPSLGVSAPTNPLPLSREESSVGQQVDPDLTRALKQIFEVRNCKLNPSNGSNTTTTTTATITATITNNNGNNNNKAVTPNTNTSNTSSNNSSEESCLTLFGRKLSSPTSSQDGNEPRSYSRQGTDKLPPAATAHLLKELHKQRLKQRGITPTASDFTEMGEIEFVHTERRPEVSTLPLLNRLQEKRVLAEDLPEPKRKRIERDPAVDLNLSMVFGAPNGGLEALEGEITNTTKDMEIENNTTTRSDAPVKNPEQLTLFYNGQVLVYDDVPSDKAKAIMVLASSISSKTSCYTPSIVVPTGSPTIAKATSLSSPNSSILQLAKKSSDKEKRSSTDVPQARKASIQRFLEKRKDRLFPKLVQSESEKGESKDRARSRSPSPGLKSMRSSDEKQCTGTSCGGVGDAQTGGPTTSTVTTTTTTVTARQWIGV